MILLLGSNNKHKAFEIKNMIKEFRLDGIDIIIPDDLSKIAFDVEENGTTLEENAKIKAEFFYNQFKLPTIADDTGLEVEVLNGIPGVQSARFSGSYGNNKANRTKLIEMLRPFPKNLWTAQFRTVICLYDNNKSHFVEGICTGRIIDKELGQGGFGYDSIFIPDGYDITFAQMSNEQKNSISHRGKAMKNLMKYLKNHYQ